MPATKNVDIRRTKYRQYWNDIQLIKSERANGSEFTVKHKMEEMPICIPKQLRTLYPNPEN